MKYFLCLLPLFCVACVPVIEPKIAPVIEPIIGVSMKLNEAAYLQADAKDTRIKVSLSDQKAWLLDSDGTVLLETDISSGIDGRETPTGTYSVKERIIEKHSNRYGRLVDKETGDVIVPKAWEHKGPIPKNLKYVGIEMPYWMRLTWSGIGMHVGGFALKERSSFGCIRVYEKAQPYIYHKTSIGTKVELVEKSLVDEMASTP